MYFKWLYSLGLIGEVVIKSHSENCRLFLKNGMLMIESKNICNLENPFKNIFLKYREWKYVEDRDKLGRFIGMKCRFYPEESK